MNKSTRLKMVVCGVALVSLSSIPAASAEITSGPCVGSGGPAFCVKVDPGPHTLVFNFGDHSFTEIITATQTFWFQIFAHTPPSCTSDQGRFPVSTETAIPYASGGTCVRYDVTPFKDDSGSPGAPIVSTDEHSYFSGKVNYIIDYNNTPPDSNNPRMLRAPTTTGNFFDVTIGFNPPPLSSGDPGVDGQDDGMSQYYIVQQNADLTATLSCLPPLDCRTPTNPQANVFATGRTVPIKIAISTATPQADIRLSFEDPNGTSHLAASSGNSNQGNKFRHAGNHFQFNWSTRGLAPGIYLLVITAGTDFGRLFAPFTIQVTLQ